jgi:hypothetical protein
MIELLDRGFGKAGQVLVEENEADISYLTSEELRAELLADFAALFPDFRIVPAKPTNSLAHSKVRQLQLMAPHDACDVD